LEAAPQLRRHVNTFQTMTDLVRVLTPIFDLPSPVFSHYLPLQYLSNILTPLPDGPGPCQPLPQPGKDSDGFPTSPKPKGKSPVHNKHNATLLQSIVSTGFPTPHVDVEVGLKHSQSTSKTEAISEASEIQLGEIFDSALALDFEKKFISVKSSRLGQSGMWLLEDEKFVDWTSPKSSCNFLHCIGLRMYHVHSCI
jgi:hypothetical protein